MKLPRIGKKHFLLYISIAAALSVVSVTFAWFAANRLVQGQDMGMAAYGSNVKVEYAVVTGETQSAYVELKPDESLSLTSTPLRPGDSLTYKIRITNMDVDPVSITAFGISKPTAAEETANKAGYYFGTQLQVQLLNVENGTPPAATAQYLAKYSDAEAKELEDPKDIPLWNGKTLAAKGASDEEGESVELTVRFTFVNLDKPQDEYILFGSEDVGGVCQRRFYIQFNLEQHSSSPQS